MLANVVAARIPVWRTCVVVLMLMGLFACQVAASTAITSMAVTNKPDCVSISVQGTGVLHMTPIQSSRYLGFQFLGKLVAKGRFIGVHSGRVHNVRYSRFSENPPVSRIVLNTSGPLDYSTEWSSDRTQVTISVWKFGAKQTGSTPNKPAAKISQTAERISFASDLPVLPPAEISGPQGSDPGIPDPEPVRLASAPMRVAALTSSAPAQVAEAVAIPIASVAVTAAKPIARPLPITVTQARAILVAQATDVPASQPAQPKKVSLNFLGADINDVLKALASQSGENIVASKDVKGEVTVSLSNVTLEEALDYVAKLSGFGYTKSNGTYLVGAKESLKSMGNGTSTASTTEVVPVKNINCDDVLNLLKAQCPDVQVTKVSLRNSSKPTGGASGGASGQAATPESSIVLCGPAESIAAAKLLLQQIDVPVENDQMVYKVQHVTPDLLAAALSRLIPGLTVDGLSVTSGTSQSSSSSGGGAGSGTPAAADSGLRESSVDQMSIKQQRPMTAATLDNVSRTLVIAGSKAQVAKAKALVEALDVKSPQIKIDAKITSLTESGEKKLGLSWNWGDLSILEDVAAPTIIKDATQGDVAISKNVTVSRGLNRYFRQPLSFGATLDALVTNGDGKLLASPSLMCLDGKPGQFFVGDQVRYVILVQQTPQGNNVQTETASVGVQLSVIGHVSDDGYITLSLHPEVSVIQLNIDKEAGVTLPTITRRYTDHVVRVKAGQTIVIGGLINDSDIDTLSKVPFLGDLPILGHLFRHRDKKTEHSEVVMFITASVVPD